MSEENEAVKTTLSCCASCGIAEVDDIKLVSCNDCDLVRYCSDECQTENKTQHEEACKKRVAELRDELLFKQPESTHLGDCPICFLPLPIDKSKSITYECCSKMICNGCDYANQKRLAEMRMRLKQTCPFCREPTLFTMEESVKLMIKRAEANDPVAMHMHGLLQYDEGNFSRAFEWFSKAAELGNVEAHFRMAGIYMIGDAVEKDEGKFLYHLEEAAIGGHPKARHDLGCYELSNDNVERAVKHHIIAAKQGEYYSSKMLMDAFKGGFVEKDVLAATLRVHQAAVDATKSQQRETADEFFAVLNGK